jgi:hypothetical protein
MIKLDIDKTVPYPESTEPDKVATLREDMQLAANTAAVLEGLGADIEDSSIAQEEADEVFAQFSEIAKKQFENAMSDKPKRGRPRTRTDTAPALLEKVPVAQRISTMLREYNNPIVADAAELRLVVTNKLLDLAGCGDPRIEIKATEMLGKISDVGLFTEKTEITVTYHNISDIDEAIKDKIRKMMKLNAIDVPSVDLDMRKEFKDPEVIEDVTPKAGEAGIEDSAGMEDGAGEEDNV